MRTYLECYRVLEEVKRDLQALKAQETASGGRAVEIAAPAGSLALTTCSLSVKSVHDLLARWHAEASKGQQCAEAWGVPGTPAKFHEGWARGLEYCIDELRAEMEATIKRQPREND